MSDIHFDAAAASDAPPRPSSSTQDSLQSTGLGNRRHAPLSRWLAPLMALIARELKADHLEEPSGAFYIGTGDQFDDDRRRIHQIE